MSSVHDDYVVCDYCGGAIPGAADKLTNVNGTLVLGGAAHGFASLDFCCTAHMAGWIGAQPPVPTPSPLYPPPPAPL